MKRICIFPIFLLLSCSAIASDADRKDLLEMARYFTILHTDTAIWHRSTEHFGAYPALEQFRKWEEAADPEIIWHLTKDANPRVRTLALIAAFDLRNPGDLPRFVPFLQDQAKAFPEDLGRFNSIGHPNSPDYKPELKSQSVSDFARAMLGTYLEAASIYKEINKETFDEYWAVRRDREYCLSWFLADMKWASKVMTPNRDGTNVAIQEVRKEIDQLANPVERDWTILALTTGIGFHSGSELLASELDRLAALKRLGPDRISDLFSGNVDWDDPDVILTEEGRRTFPYAAVVNFVLQHAAEVFTAEDFPKMLEWKSEHQQREERNIYPRFPSVRWTIAASDLRPERARNLLLKGLEEIPYNAKSTSIQDERTYLVMALWKHEGEAALKEVVDWFYGETPNPNAFGFGRHRFCDWMGSEKYLNLIVKIFEDKRITTLGFSSLGYLVRASNKAAGKEIIPHIELNQAENDFGRSLTRGGPPAPELLPDDWEKRRSATLLDWVSRFQ